MKIFALTVVASLLCSVAVTGQERDALKVRGAKLKERVVQKGTDLSERVSKKFAALRLLLQGNKTEEGQKVRFELFQLLLRLKLFQLWAHNPKKWYTWIVTGEMPVKCTDSRVRDTEYVQHFLLYKKFVIGRTLTKEEEQSARAEAMELLNAYAVAKGLRHAL